MIIDRLENAAIYASLCERMAKGLEYLRNTDFRGLEDGRHEIEGDEIYAMVMGYKTEPAGEGVWEAHRRYTDIQYMVSGAERMGYANLSDLSVKDAYDENKDALFLEGVGSFFVVREGAFAVFGPEDAHMPGMALAQPESVRKVVVKVRVD